MAFYLGIDGGGTKTTCAVGDESSVLGSATAAGSNIVRVGEAAARKNLHAAIREACAAARAETAQIVGVCAGLAGLGATHVTAAVRQIVAEIVPGHVEVVGDMEIAMEAAFGDGPGVIVIAGTGSIAFGRDERGQTARAGGWGFAISDEGSGQWIGRTAVSAAMRAYDRGQSDTLLSYIMRAWHAASVHDVDRFSNALPPPNFAELFPHVRAAAEAGDALAVKILTDAGTELGVLAEIVLHRLWPGGAAVNVAMTGGVCRSSEAVRRAFVNHLRAAQTAVTVMPGIVEPVMGALARARKAPLRAGTTGR